MEKFHSQCISGSVDFFDRFWQDLEQISRYAFGRVKREVSNFFVTLYHFLERGQNFLLLRKFHRTLANGKFQVFEVVAVLEHLIHEDVQIEISVYHKLLIVYAHSKMFGLNVVRFNVQIIDIVPTDC